MADLEGQLLQALNEKECIADSGDFAKSQGVDHMAVVGVIRSLQASEMIVAEVGPPCPSRHARRASFGKGHLPPAPPTGPGQ